MMNLRKWTKDKRLTDSKKNKRGLKKGYRSGLESKLSEQISKAGYEVLYEQEKIKYIVPERNAKYCPDFKLIKKDGSPLWIESKGLFPVGDRQKHIHIKNEYGDAVDIRFVFSNARAKLYKGSKTTYGEWCEKHGFQYSHKWIPDSWFEELSQK